jgi:hypothetical protein
MQTSSSSTLTAATGVPRTSAIADLHVHTTYSDGVAGVVEMLERASTIAGLSVIAITDHDCIEGSLQAAQLAPQYGLEAVIGEEVSTQHGHILALFIERHIEPGKSAWETIAEIHAQGGLAIAAHPFDATVPSLGVSCLRPQMSSLGLDGLEGFNASIYWPLRAFNMLAQAHAHRWHLPVIGGSDAHSPATLGKGFTTFAGRSAEDLFHAIKSGQVACGGHHWSLRQHANTWRQAAQRLGLVPLLRWAWQNVGQPSSGRRQASLSTDPVLPVRG